jgi:hypothetical protein
MKKKIILRLSLMTVLLLMLAVSKPGWAQPDLTEVCQGVTCGTLQTSICSGPFKIALQKFEPATPLNSGTATYT